MQWTLPRALGLNLQPPPPFSLNFAVSACIHGPVTQEELRRGLDRLARRHPLLAVRVVAGVDGEAYFTDVAVPPIPLRVVARGDQQEWARETAHEITVPSDYWTGPLARCVWLQGDGVADLVLIVDHAVADGRAAIYVLRDLLVLIGDPTRPLAPLPPVALAERLLPATRARIRQLGAMAAAPAAPRIPPPAAAVAAAAIPPLQVLPSALDEDATTLLVARCRAEGVSVHAALCVALLLPCITRASSASTGWIEVPVDLRGRLTPPVGEECGVYISTVKIAADCVAGRGLWDIAREVQAAMAAALVDERLFAAPMVQLYVADCVPWARLVDPWCDVSVSNLGRLDIPERYGALRLSSVYGPMLNAGHACRVGVTTFGRCLHYVCISRNPDMARIAGHARELLAALIGPV